MAESKILNRNLTNRLSQFYGIKILNNGEIDTSEAEKMSGFKFVPNDLDNKFTSISTDSPFTLGSIRGAKLNTRVSELFSQWSKETSFTYDDIADRQKRLAAIKFLISNEPYCNTFLELAVGEATQLDSQNRLISCICDDEDFTKDVYSLLEQWGITHSRTEDTLYNIIAFAEGVWTLGITEEGITKIRPIPPTLLRERIEFSPIRFASYLAELNGRTNSISKSKIQKLKNILEIYQDTTEYGMSSVASMLDSKLFGYELDGDIFAAPYEIIHFRYRHEQSDFAPYGDPFLLGTLAAYSKVYSNYQLDNLAKTLSLPMTIYTVKAKGDIDPLDSFSYVNTVRENYENLPVGSQQGFGEVLAPNTSIWVYENVLEVKIEQHDVRTADADYHKMLLDHMRSGFLIPKEILDPDATLGNQSGISLTKKYKPFGRKMFSYQSTYLEGLVETIRLHFAITGKHDYKKKFLLSMKFPIEEESEDKFNQYQKSKELVDNIIEQLKTVLGLSDEDVLPDEVIKDIMFRYSFLDPTVLKNWIYKIKSDQLVKDTEKGENDNEESVSNDGENFNFDGGETTDIVNEPAPEPELVTMPESGVDILTIKKAAKNIRNKKQLIRMKEIVEKYNKNKNGIFAKFMESAKIPEIIVNNQHYHNAQPLNEDIVTSLQNDGLFKGNKETITRNGMTLFRENANYEEMKEAMNKAFEKLGFIEDN